MSSMIPHEESPYSDLMLLSPDIVRNKTAAPPSGDAAVRHKR
jgi:hypothetical protein